MENDPNVNTAPATAPAAAPETAPATALAAVPAAVPEAAPAADTAPQMPAPQMPAAEISLEPPVAKLPAMPEPPAAAAQPAITDADALAASRLVKLLSEAEERGYMRARRELTAAKAPAAQHAPLWSNPRRIEAEAESTIEIGDEFLATIRPTIWD